jgi:formate-nitrite transporter family protein
MDVSSERDPDANRTGDNYGGRPRGVSEHEVEDIEDRARLRTPVIYEIVRREGEVEMERPITSLW